MVVTIRALAQLNQRIHELSGAMDTPISVTLHKSIFGSLLLGLCTCSPTKH